MASEMTTRQIFPNAPNNPGLSVVSQVGWGPCTIHADS